MFKLKLTALAILAAFCPSIIQAQSAITIGAIADPGQLSAQLAQLAANGQSVAGGTNFQTTASATPTLTALGNLTQRITTGGASTVTLDSAYNIVKTLPTPLALGQTFTFMIVTNAATTVATPTLSDTAVTLSGTTTVTAAGARWYQGAVTQINSTTGSTLTAGSTFTSIAQIGTTNNFTVTLGTNAIVPTVGNLFYIGTTTGTLPAGWYPINAVTSATSFVVALPVGTVWTATAATLLSSAVAPSTYSPLVTITGMYATVLNLFTV